MKSFEIEWNCNLSPMIFSMSFPNMLKKTIGQKALGESYNSLLGLEIIIDINTLKCEVQ